MLTGGINDVEGSFRSIDRIIELLSVVEAGSIAAAAEREGVSRSTLSRRVAALEDAVGVKLINRNSRSLSLTHAGELLVQRARRIVSEADDAWHDILSLSDSPSGPLRVSTPPSQQFIDLLVGFALAYPDVRLLVESTHRHVDLVREGVDVALRFGDVEDEQLMVRRLGTTRVSLVAAQKYVHLRGCPMTIDDLAGHRCIVNYGQTGLPRPAWPTRGGGLVNVEPHFACEGLHAGLEAAKAGVGVALLPDMLTQPLRAEGQLVFVLRDEVGMEMPGQLVYPNRKYVLPAVRAFIDFSVEYFRGRESRL